MAGKWNWETHKYDPYELPEGCILYSPDLTRITACAQCGLGLTIGEAFTSREIHNDSGLGYPVCEDCHNEEWKREKEAKK